MTPEEILKKHFDENSALWLDKDFNTFKESALYQFVVLPSLTKYANAKAKEAAEKAYSQAWADKDIPFVNFDNVKEQYLSQQFPEQ